MNSTSNKESFFDLDMSLGSPVKEIAVQKSDDKPVKKMIGIGSTSMEASGAIAPTTDNNPSPKTTSTSISTTTRTTTTWSRANQEAVMNEATKWRTDLEMMRDEMHILSVKNAVLLDSMAMADGEFCAVTSSIGS